MKRSIIIFFLLPILVFSQSNIDSLWAVWNNETQTDSNRLKAMQELAWGYFLFSNPDTAYRLADQQYIFAKKKGLKKYMALALNTQGASYYVRGQVDSILFYWNKCYTIYKDLNDKKGIATSLGNIGVIYDEQGNQKKALEYYKRALIIHEEIENKHGIARNLVNIGAIYSDQDNIDKAMEYYSKALELDKMNGNKQGIARSLGNIGTLHSKKGDLVMTRKYYSNALKIYEDIGNKQGMAFQLVNIGNVYLEENNYDKALDYLYKAKKIAEESGFNDELTMSLYCLGNVYKNKGEYTKALYFSKLSLEKAQKTEVAERIMNASKSLWEIYKSIHRKDLALDMHELYISMRDSIQNEENQRASLQMQYKYEYDKKTTKDSITYAKEKVIKQALIEKQQAVIEVQRNRQVALYSGIGLVMLFSLFMYNRYKVTQSQKVVIQEQKEEVESQKEKIEDAHQEIKDSIIYAKRIQEAILPSLPSINESLPISFILYQPKDIVAGDFYWQENYKNKVYIAAADCTGHGVPGAMVSVVCSNALSKTVLEDGITDVGKILDRTREIVIDKLAKSGDVKDGMDISLGCLDFEEMKLEWAGANNPLYLLRNSEIQITKGDREPIGYTENPTPFTKHTFDLQKSDTIYLFTDGYADQFGGDEGKKLGYKKFREKLLEISPEEMDKQQELLSDYFNKWKGSEEQVDDVCLIGIKV